MDVVNSFQPSAFSISHHEAARTVNEGLPSLTR